MEGQMKTSTRPKLRRYKQGIQKPAQKGINQSNSLEECLSVMSKDILCPKSHSNSSRTGQTYEDTDYQQPSRYHVSYPTRSASVSDKCRRSQGSDMECSNVSPKSHTDLRQGGVYSRNSAQNPKEPTTIKEPITIKEPTKNNVSSIFCENSKRMSATNSTNFNSETRGYNQYRSNIKMDSPPLRASLHYSRGTASPSGILLRNTRQLYTPPHKSVTSFTFEGLNCSSHKRQITSRSAGSEMRNRPLAQQTKKFSYRPESRAASSRNVSVSTREQINGPQIRYRCRTAMGHYNYLSSFMDVSVKRSTKSAGSLGIRTQNKAEISDMNSKEAIADLANQLQTYIIDDNFQKFQAVLEEWGPETQRRAVNFKAISSKGSSVFYRACQLSKMSFIEFMLSECAPDLELTGVYSDTEDDSLYQVTPLWLAAATGNLDMVCLLASYGANVNATSPSGCSAVTVACGISHVAIVSFLIAHGAIIHTKTASGMTCLMSAVRSLELTKLLTHHGAKINEGDQQGNTAVHYASQSGKLDTLKLLMEKGGNPLMANTEGRTALDIAAKNRRAAIMEYLIVTASPHLEDIIRAYSIFGVMSILVDSAYPTGLTYWRKGLQLVKMKRQSLAKTGHKTVLGQLVQVEEVTSLDYLTKISTDNTILCMHALDFYERVFGPMDKYYSFLLLYRGDVSAEENNLEAAIPLWRVAYKLLSQRYLDSDKGHAGMFNDNLLDTLRCLTKGLYYCREHHRYKVENSANVISEEEFTDLFRCVCYHISVAGSIPTHGSNIYLNKFTLLLQLSMCLVFVYLKLFSPSVRTPYFGAHVKKLIKLNPRGEDGRTLLHLCLQQETLGVIDVQLTDEFLSWPSHAMLEILLLLGADPVSRDRNGNTVCHLAVELHNQTGMVGPGTMQMLLRLGAHADQVNHRGETAADLLPSHDQLHHVLNATTTLKCLAARTIAKLRIHYIGEVPISLYNFIKLHSHNTFLIKEEV